MMGLILSDLGADVLKIEGPQGDPVRGVPPFAFGQGLMYHALNRGKKTMTLDLGQTDDREHIIEAIRNTDIVLEGFRPGVLENMGIDPKGLTDIKPSLLFVRMSAFGQKAGDRPAHDLNLMGIAGALGMSDSLEPLPVQAADITSAVLGTLTVLAALMDGRGGELDIPLMAGAHMASFPLYTRFTGPDDTQEDNLLLEGGYPLYRMYETRGHKKVSVAAIEPKFVKRIAGVTGLKNLEEQKLGAWFAKRSLEDIIEAFSMSPACIEPVQAPWDAVHHSAMKAMFAPLSDGDKTYLLPVTPFASPEDIPAKGPWVRKVVQDQ